MSGYDSNNDSTTGEPLLIGVIGFNCASCNSTTVPQYELSCHESDDLHCRDCLTKKWYTSNDEIVRCPHRACGQICGFMPLRPLSEVLHLDNRFYDTERIDRIRQQPEVMNNLIAFTREEAEVALQQVYSFFEDQILDPVALGGVPGHVTEGAQNSLLANFSFNPFFTGLLEELKAAPKLMTTPLELEEDLNQLLSRLLYTYATQYHGDELARQGVDLEHEEAVLGVALQNYKPIKDIKEVWAEMIKRWVDLLAWRHLERLSSPEGGAAERQH
ncbi:uncharacterized protein K460DRAFT_286750 [Cucurbitaria berberidis CBS 394.84]|uniref:Uncharacterized protein n=1 Tax=Cucurbitaria berberidis CBS 394.84 TaxID=1168544 RepID=A0A9P4L8M2_9PLEO|nr:uncharacterized protein K460DRAFT_286750 [Cucurbitaria berberidis CBS 394.84]KAF1846200.1 hypothetical protein K460DRAFT_286750 [Cucurbitaria berberidis CBS 394.84]